MDEGGWDKFLNFFFSSVSPGEAREGASPCFQSTPAPGVGDRYFGY